ncbi:hypothetical protein DPMN_114092 [Dreissena polymorpha]|uniref:Uncharacterized protein n=1 Tax=Dreissena polymorpha TaxID=45954 RepID=A0A9D4KJH0_DREPO|nr:hypothetical protein DPMN_114092 [Dreissena polymorpha]
MEEPVPKSPIDYRRFIAEVDAVTACTDSDKPVVLHCWNGASKCGLFCVVANLLQKMALEHEVSVVTAVRTVNTRRKGAIPNLEQFQFCHDCVLDYVQMLTSSPMLPLISQIAECRHSAMTVSRTSFIAFQCTHLHC